MRVGDDPDAIPPVQAEVQAAVDHAEGRPRPLPHVERFDFYELAKTAYAVIQTGERRFYGCFMLRMGVIPPED
jgi:L-fucose mutarotase